MNDDIFDNIPDYSLDEIDRILDELNTFIVSFGEHIELARDTLDKIDDEISNVNEKIYKYDAEIKDLTENIYFCETEIAELTQRFNCYSAYDYTTEKEDEDDFDQSLYDIECDIDLFECEKVNLIESIAEITHKIHRTKSNKNNLIQTSSNILYSVKLKLNDIRQYKI